MKFLVEHASAEIDPFVLELETLAQLVALIDTAPRGYNNVIVSTTSLLSQRAEEQGEKLGVDFHLTIHDGYIE